jgi:chromosome segregation ATPase
MKSRLDARRQTLLRKLNRVNHEIAATKRDLVQLKEQIDQLSRQSAKAA